MTGPRRCLHPFLFALLMWLGAGLAAAHEVRPAYLSLREVGADRFDVLFKTPMSGDLRLALYVRFPDGVTAEPGVARPTGDAMVQSWSIRAPGGLGGKSIEIDGLESTMTDALVRVEFADGHVWNARLTPSSPATGIPDRPGLFDTMSTYLVLGVEHILAGFDHLLFVAGLMLLTGANRRIVTVITAFTAAHSLTLAAATLGYANVPQRPVEAVIALSIVFLAVEILRSRAGRTSITSGMPWIAAFLFGLLHGFGFAGALAEVGLPAGQVPVALLFFNLGVEAGQLLFVAALALAITLAGRLTKPMPRWTQAVPAYALGSIAMVLVVQRLSNF
jgi:hydrogenase/urease accessory protein HupE